jgi:hypothetical protein
MMVAVERRVRELRRAGAVPGKDEETSRPFWQVAELLDRRIDLFCGLPLNSLDSLRLEQATRDIARQENTVYARVCPFSGDVSEQFREVCE